MLNKATYKTIPLCQCLWWFMKTRYFDVQESCKCYLGCCVMCLPLFYQGAVNLCTSIKNIFPEDANGKCK